MPTRSTRRSKRLAAKEAAKAEAEAAAFQEEGLPSTSSPRSPRRKSTRKRKPSMKEENDSPTSDFRHAVQTMLDSPDKVNLPKKNRVAPSPRIDRITIQNKNHEETMEFLIPPKRTSEPLEIREQIRSFLDFSDDEPGHTTKGKSTLDVPVRDGNTKLWSPHCPDLTQDKQDRTSKMLVAVIFSILTAVFCSYYHTEIAEALYTAASMASEWAGQFVNWVIFNVTSVWEAIQGLFSTEKGTEGSGEEELDISDMDDSVTR